MTCATLAPDLFIRPHADLDDVQARIGAAVAFAAERTTGRSVPADLAAGLGYARSTLDDLGAIKGRAAHAEAFRAEHGIETMKGLWFAFADHAGLLGLRIAEVAL